MAINPVEVGIQFCYYKIKKEYKCMVIGGSDGPTSIFLAGKIGTNIFDVFGLVLIILLLVPNIIYATQYKNQRNQCKNRVMNVLEQIGRYGCMFFMIFHIGFSQIGLSSFGWMLLYWAGDILMMICYWAVWMMFFAKPDYKKQLALAIIPCCMFLFSGIVMTHYLLVITGIVFTIAHIYVTMQNKISVD